MQLSELTLSVTDTVAFLNQTLEAVYPVLTIEGELSSFRVSKGKWLYFDLKDDISKLHFFGTVYALPAPLEDGMLLKVTAEPRIHPQFGFSLNIRTIQLSGEGTIKKASQLLEMKLAKEGLFDIDRKRTLPYPPQKIGLITSAQSAAYADFIKIIDSRWKGLEIDVYDVQVQGESAVDQIVSAINFFNMQAELVDVLVVIRGGGSIDDLGAFSTEQVTRAVSASRIPTLVAIGHEIDISLAELASDQRASTPSNAAELLVPNTKDILSDLGLKQKMLDQYLDHALASQEEWLSARANLLDESIGNIIERVGHDIESSEQILDLYNPINVLKRGYSIVRSQKTGKVVRATNTALVEKSLEIQFSDGSIKVEVQ